MEYRNTKTGAVISVNSEVVGGDWVPVTTTPIVEKETKAPRKKKVQKSE